MTTLSGSVRLVDADKALELFWPVYERVRAGRPGMLSRDERWWKEHRLADPESWRHGAGKKFYAAVEIDNRVEGYALYRVKDEWQDGFARGEVRVIEALATSPAAEKVLWRYLHEIDLTVTRRRPPASTPARRCHCSSATRARSASGSTTASGCGWSTSTPRCERARTGPAHPSCSR